MRCMAGRGHQPDAVGDHMIIGNQVHKPGLIHRQHRIGEARMLIGNLVLRY